MYELRYDIRTYQNVYRVHSKQDATPFLLPLLVIYQMWLHVRVYNMLNQDKTIFISWLKSRINYRSWQCKGTPPPRSICWPQCLDRTIHSAPFMHNSQLIIITLVLLGRTIPTSSLLTASTHAQVSSPTHLCFFLFMNKKHKVPLHCLQHPPPSCIQRQPFQFKNCCIQNSAASGKWLMKRNILFAPFWRRHNNEEGVCKAKTTRVRVLFT